MATRLRTRRIDSQNQRAQLARVRDSLAAGQKKPVMLRVVAVILHRQLGGAQRAAMRGPEYLRLLNDAASTLSKIADIYRVDLRGLTKISTQELVDAEFQDGGNIVRTAAGARYRPLAMLRGEAIAAITFLVNAKTED